MSAHVPDPFDALLSTLGVEELDAIADCSASHPVWKWESDPIACTIGLIALLIDPVTHAVPNFIWREYDYDTDIDTPRRLVIAIVEPGDKDYLRVARERLGSL